MMLGFGVVKGFVIWLKYVQDPTVMSHLLIGFAKQSIKSHWTSSRDMISSTTGGGLRNEARTIEFFPG